MNIFIRRFQRASTPEEQLYHSSWRGDLASCKQLVSEGVHVNWQGEGGMTALMCACSSGHAPVVAFLLQSGAAVGLETESGSTAFFMAAMKLHPEICGLLLEHGARWDIPTREGATAMLMLGVMSGISPNRGRAEEILDLICRHANVDRAFLANTLPGRSRLRQREQPE